MIYTASPRWSSSLYGLIPWSGKYLSHRVTGSYQSWPSKNSKAKRYFFLLITHLLAKPGLKWWEAIYCLHFSHLVWTVHCSEMNGFDYGARPQTPAGVLHNIQYICPRSSLKSKNAPSSKTRLTPKGFRWQIVDMHLLFPWDSCNHSYHSLQPKDTENWCLPITKWLFISLWKRNLGCFPEWSEKWNRLSSF